MEFFMTYILPVLVVGVLAAVFAFCLSFLGEKLTIDRDARIDEIERNLAGANCGGCGYPGCAAFAEALFKGEAKPDRCNPTSAVNKANIAKILGMSEEKSRETVAVVHCIGGNKCRNKYDYQGYGDCESAQLIADGNKACEVGCMGLGSCSESCKFDAISVDRDLGFAIVDSPKCTSCGACVAVCPKKIIGRIPKDAKVYVACSNTHRGKEVSSVCERGCIGCGLCAKNCPTGAIELSNNLAAIDYDKCIGCEKCKEVCPRKCILPFDMYDNAAKRLKNK
ncbi:MAG: RnfABCDGE type electron transport complex subunit B [Clostridia bacterium]|nr:RnfABCDGE type electron transport complex subunit B [Clostridia bacterium]